MPPRFKTFVKNFGVFIAALLGALGWVATSGWTALDHRFVHSDSFAIYQQGVSGRRQLDSAGGAQFQQRTDSSLARLLRACERHGDCQ